MDGVIELKLRHDIHSVVVGAIAEQVDVMEGDFDAALAGTDHLDRIEIVMRIEERLSRVFPDALADAMTVADLEAGVREEMGR